MIARTLACLAFLCALPEPLQAREGRSPSASSGATSRPSYVRIRELPGGRAGIYSSNGSRIGSLRELPSGRLGVYSNNGSRIGTIERR